MAARSLTATPDGINQINRALTEKKWSREDLARQCDCSRQPAVKFCAGKSVSNKLFVSFCEALALDWQDIAGLKQIGPIPDLNQSKTDIDVLVQDIREKVKADIHNRCGTMRVLDMEQPIGIGDIYTNVNILEKLSGRRRLGITELLEDCDIEDFDRFTLGQVHHERVLGLEAVERYDKLMILGKPGAGKTTFMKRIATLCNHGEFQAHCVPVFVTLKEFAEAKGKPDLQTYVAKQWKACKVKEPESLALVLDAGRGLLLLDGLDEVQEGDHDRVLQAIKDFTREFHGCQFVISCRIAAREYTFQQFTEVEVADFNQNQIEEFAKKWFSAKNDPEKSKSFIKRLQDNEPIQELATNPLLLTLLCLVFGEGGDFPRNRAELYKEGLDVLLKKWDTSRNIERDRVYKKLSLKRKEDLLSQLAFQTFERGNYFFKQRVVEKQIIDYIRNLPEANESESALQLDSEAVLKSIEAQHGLLVERARGIYSFSHLTFHEYFTARQIVSPTDQLHLNLENLVTHITHKHYRELILLAVGMLPKADDLLSLIKQAIEKLISDDTDINKFLSWLYEKAQSTDTSYKPEAVRAFYLTRELARNRALYLARGYDPPKIHALARACDIARSKGILIDLAGISNITRKFDGVSDLAHTLGLDLNSKLNSDIALDFPLNLSLTLALTFDEAFDRGLALDPSLAFALSSNFAFGLDLALNSAILKADKFDPELKLKLKELKDQLPSYKNLDTFRKWWKVQEKTWSISLRSLMIEHRNIGHEWYFTNTQQKRLLQYYNTNQLLVDCLNSDCYVTKATRQEIEETLLLPMSEIEKRKERSSGE